MYGAIFGDIIGSRFEFDRGGKTKDFRLFTEEDDFTDDTAMTIAVADGLLKAGKDATVEEIHQAVTRSMRYWADKYPNAGYGGRFYRWLFCSKNPRPYGSYGNGSAMRVSAAGWLYDSLERTREVAKATAEVTHNHPEGIKGAECTAAVIYLSRTGSPKADIREYVAKEFGYDMSRSVDQLRPLHEHVESCQDSMPKALASFFEGDSYEDVVRNAVSLGGDTDTLAAIAGAMAEAFYGIPVLIVAEGQKYLPQDMQEVIDRFHAAISGNKDGGDGSDTPTDYGENAKIKLANHFYNQADTQQKRMDCILRLLYEISLRMKAEGECPTPFVDKTNVTGRMDLNELCLGKTFSFPEDLHLVPDTMTDGNGHIWLPLFTDEEELAKGQTGNIIINFPIAEIIRSGYDREDLDGVVLNPFGESRVLPKELLKILLDHIEDEIGGDINDGKND